MLRAGELAADRIKELDSMLALAVFLCGALTAGYIFIGYPICLKFVAKWRARPIVKGSTERSVSVVICVYNGAHFVRKKLRSLLEQNYPRELMEILVLSDGSTDGTDAIVREFEDDGVQLIRLPHGGKPAALNVGFARARNEILVLTDVRQTLDRQCVRGLVGCFDDPQVGVVSGELAIRSGDTREEGDIGAYWRFESWMRRQLARVDSMFGATGPIYAIRRRLAVELPPEILLDDMYLPLTAFFRGYRLVVEEQARAYDHPSKLDSEFPRKVRTLAGNLQILRYMPQLLGPKNRMWFHFVSYKLGRLTLPYLLIVVTISSFYLPGPWRLPILMGIAGSFSLAVLDPWISQRLPIKRISSPARTFLVMMIATVSAIRVFFVPPRKLWKESTIQPSARPAEDTTR